MQNYNIKRALKIKCKHCREELNLAEKYFLDTDSKKWDCSQCNREVQVFGGMIDCKGELKDFGEYDEVAGTITISVFITRGNESVFRRFAVWKNKSFREIKTEYDFEKDAGEDR